MRMKQGDLLVFASSNPGKLIEARKLLADLPVDLRYLNDFSRVIEPVEDGATFRDNSALKAAYYARHTGHWTIADDSGLEVVSLDGRPGVLSARFGGPGLSDQDRIRLLLQAITSAGAADRGARFVCSIVLAGPDGGIVASFEGACDGQIADAPKGDRGFGYDPVFVPSGYDQTFGELPDLVKQKLSHRSRALALFRAYLLDSPTTKA